MPEATNDKGFAMTSSFPSMALAAWLVLGTVAAPGELVGRLAAAAERLLAARLAGLKRSMHPGSVIAITATDAGADDPSFWLVGGLEGVEDAMLALPFVVVAQLLGLCFSLALGYTPDNPFPNQKVNRVVQGVSIHPPPKGRR